MQPGLAIRRKATTGEAQTERLIERATEEFRKSFDGSAQELRRLTAMGRIARVDYELPSRSDPEAPSDDRLSVVWEEDVPVIIALETRDERNFVDTVLAYPGPVRSHRQY